MAFICYFKDVSVSEKMREAATAEHLAYIESILEHLLVAGPLSAEDGDGYNASCFIYDTDDRDEALSLLHNDPYFKAGIYEQVSCRRFLPAAGSWIGGKIW